MKNPHFKNLLILHLCVFIWGFTPVIGKAISLQALDLVWWRVFLSVIAIYIYICIKKINISIGFTDGLKLLGVGVIIGLHWLAFYGAIKVSNISVSMTAFSSGTLFSSLINPLLFKRRIKGYEIFFGIVIILIIGFIFSTHLNYKLGILLGLLAAFGSALFSAFNGLLTHQINAYAISFYELLGACLSLSVILFFEGHIDASFFMLSTTDLIYLILLSVVATAFTSILSVQVLKSISPYTLIMTLNLETVYSIILAFIWFRQSEQMDFRFYIGTLVLLAVIVLNGYFKSRERTK